MALNPTPVGDAIAAFVKLSAPTPGTAVTDAQLKALWEGIVTILYNDLKANLSTTPGTFEVTVTGPGTFPVIGASGPAL